MTPNQFITKWTKADLSERSASQQHFLDLCDMLGQPKPADVDPKGLWYTFEKGVEKADGGKGWADVWMQGRFGWEYKGKHKDLRAAYQQLLKYREALDNPPLLVVSDLDRLEIHTNFTGTAKRVHAFGLDGLADPANLLLLRNVFSNPDALKPGQTQKAVTEEVAGRFGRLADALSRRGVPPESAAHFLMKLMFCMFAEDIDLLPRDLFTRTVANSKNDPARLSRLLKSLFRAMQAGEPFGADEIQRFNGGLFADSETIDLLPNEIEELHEAARCDWSSVEPTIFGTLFERSLDPDKRSQIGAHYTSREDIETLLKPVLLAPLRREWEEARTKADKLWQKVKEQARKQGDKRGEPKARRDFVRLIDSFAERMAHVTVLDPACGSGNFLYVAIHLLLDLEKEVLNYADERGVGRFPLVRSTQLFGVEINAYAQQLAQVVVWVGYLQWKYFNGYQSPRDPVLDPSETIRHADAILDLSDPANPKEPEWPEAEFIVGNPPFLGGKLLRTNLGDGYVDAMFRVWGERVRPEADLCCYWFEKARAMIEAGKAMRAGLLGTQGIRGGANRDTLARIKESGDIFFAISDREWILNGANVHISMVGFDGGAEKHRTLDGSAVSTVNTNLSASADITTARILKANKSVAFQGPVKVGPFDITGEQAAEYLGQPNVHGHPNSDILLLLVNGADLTGRSSNRWIIEFGSRSLDEASKYEGPFEFVAKTVKPLREANKDRQRREYWWRLGRSGSEWKRAALGLDRTLFSPRISKHRLFVWAYGATLPDCQVVAFARPDDYFFGLLHSRPHEVWSLKLGTRLETRPRYTPTTCFETFPFPEPTHERKAAVAAAAKELDALRTNWLNPAEWTKTAILEFPGSAGGPWGRYLHDPDARGIGTVRYPRTVPRDAAAAESLKKRTLTNLYNESPTWLKNAHRRLDEAVFAAYGWPPDLSDDEILTRLLDRNLSQAAATGAAAEASDAEIESEDS